MFDFISLLFLYKYLLLFFYAFSFYLFLKILDKIPKLEDGFAQYELKASSSYLIVLAFIQYPVFR